MKYSSVVPSQDLQDESGLGALDFEVAVSAVSNSKSEKRKSRKVHDWKVSCHQWPHCCCKKNRIKEPTSQWKYRKRVLCHVQSRARESQEKKRPIVPNLNVLPRGRPLFWGSLNQMVQKILLALRSRGGLITSVIVVSAHGSHQSWKVLERCWNSGKVLERSWNFFVVKQSKREISK